MPASGFAVEMLLVALVGPILLEKHYFSPCRDSICNTEGSLGSEPMFAIYPKSQVLQY